MKCLLKHSSFAIIFLTIVFLSACSINKANNVGLQPKLNKQQISYTALNTNIQTLSKLLPYRENFQWKYNGFAEYGHFMKLQYIEKTGTETRYNISGTVDDMSGGESKIDNNLKLTYIISNNTLMQKKTEQRMLDSKFNSIELVRLPLSKTAKWTQYVLDKSGKTIILDCVITDISVDNGQNIYSIYYKDRNSKYYEKRKIKQGVGVIWFEKLFESKDGDFPVTYSLYVPLTGYSDKLVLNSYLPPLNKTLRFFGLAEYAHKGILKQISTSSESSVYQFNGEYTDGSGIPGTFKVQYIFDYLKGTILEKVIENTRKKTKSVNSILNNFVILKLPIQVGSTWFSNITINGNKNEVQAKIIDISYRAKTIYSPYVSDYDRNNPIITVRYIVNNVPGYYKNTYIEERKFQIGRGMIGFSNLMPGSLPISPKDLQNPLKVEEAVINHMFGYSLAVNEIK
ncbi:MAG: hypothetical protein ACM3KR_10955 [Deltaproteobacteria bacterium]